MEMLAKIRDAAGMLWLNLDDGERRLVLLAGVYLAVTVVFALEGKRREQEKARIRELVREVIVDARSDR